MFQIILKFKFLDEVSIYYLISKLLIQPSACIAAFTARTHHNRRNIPPMMHMCLDMAGSRVAMTTVARGVRHGFNEQGMCSCFRGGAQAFACANKEGLDHGWVVC
ncbi:hypothetical protein TNCT_61781 [Trichonephila clavata]|uniref:Uncharacterized protein n=1 Tax=Trichonephila clavata TaxID=2740835 RepID=A0A8X6I2Q0_TRICU|nr:hypothetical protein TNCT_61781 [Trichonephila clavata]